MILLIHTTFKLRSVIYKATKRIYKMCLLSIIIGYIDLSKKNVTEDDVEACNERFIKSKTVSSSLQQKKRFLFSKVLTFTNSLEIFLGTQRNDSCRCCLQHSSSRIIGKSCLEILRRVRSCPYWFAADSEVRHPLLLKIISKFTHRLILSCNLIGTKPCWIL